MSAPRIPTARDVFEAHPALRVAIPAGPTEASAVAYLGGLATSPTPEDALTFCAHALAEREAVWWGMLCLAELQHAPPGPEDSCLQAAKAWLRAPGQETRHAALATGLAADPRAATTWLARAAGWSAAAEAEREAGRTTPTAVGTAVLSALARVGARERAGRLHACVRVGMQLLHQQAG